MEIVIVNGENHLPEEEAGTPVGDAVGGVAAEIEKDSEKNDFQVHVNLKIEVQIVFLICTYNLKENFAGYSHLYNG